MRPDNDLSLEDRSFEQLLRGLRPARPATGERFLYEAGRRSMRRSLWAWRGIAAVFAAGMVLSPGVRSVPRSQEMNGRPVESLAAMPQAPSASPPSTTGYARLRDRVLAEGLDVLPAPTGGADTAPVLGGGRCAGLL